VLQYWYANFISSSSDSPSPYRRGAVIRRVALASGEVQTLEDFGDDWVHGLAVDGSRVYWAADAAVYRQKSEYPED